MQAEQERLEKVRSMLSNTELKDESLDSPSKQVAITDDDDDELLRLQRVRAILELQSSPSVATPSTKENRPSLSLKTKPAVSSSSVGKGDTVFDRLYGQRKTTKEGLSSDSDFHPKINSKSRQIASSFDRGSLYDRAVQQRNKLEYARTLKQREEQEQRNRSKVNSSSKEMAWNKLKKEVVNLFRDRILAECNDPEALNNEDYVFHANQVQFSDILLYLCLSEAQEEIYRKLANADDGLVSMASFCDFLKQISFPNGEELLDELGVKVRMLLLGRKAVPSTTSLERVVQEVAEQTPFVPQITERSRILDQKRAEKLGIDPSLPLAEKIGAEIKMSTEKKASIRLQYTQKELEECTFRPKTKAFNFGIKINKPKEDFESVPKDVGSRLYKDSVERRTRQQMRNTESINRSISELESMCTFRPSTNATKKIPKASFDTPSKVKSFESSVERFRSWRLKHVYEEDKADIAYSQKKAQPHKLKKKDQPSPLYVRDLKPRNEVLFEAVINLPNGKSEEIHVRYGDDVKAIAAAFVRKHRLDEDLELALLDNLTQGLLQANEELEEEVPQEAMKHDEFSEEEEDDDDVITVDVTVRPNETYTLSLSIHDDTEKLATLFAEDVGMDDLARDRLIHTLNSLLH